MRATGARLAIGARVVRGVTRGLPDIAPRPDCPVLPVAGLPVTGGGAGAGVIRGANSGVPAMRPRQGACTSGCLVLPVAGLPAAGEAATGTEVWAGGGVAMIGVGNALEAGVVRGATRGFTAARRPIVEAAVWAGVGMTGAGNALDAEVAAGAGGIGLTPPWRVGRSPGMTGGFRLVGAAVRAGR